MTITSEERRADQSSVRDFERQESEDTCLSRAIENIISEVSKRHGVPNLRLSHERIKEVCAYKPDWGCDTSILPENLNSEIADYGYTCKIETGIELDRLGGLAEEAYTSYPIAELAPEYLHDQDGYSVRAGMHGKALPHLRPI
ncbi:MAG: hypothetical protein ABEI86_10180 [Halobacteriaceae archaeon]